MKRDENKHRNRTFTSTPEDAQKIRDAADDEIIEIVDLADADTDKPPTG